MITADIINSIFEFAGGFLGLLNVQKILKDKSVVGVYWPVQVFFSVWGFWNLYYYPSLGQWASFVGGIFLVTGNTVWSVLAGYYSYKERTRLDPAFAADNE